MAISGSDVYVGGPLFTAGGQTVSGVAQWDGLRWSGLGEGLNDRVMAIAVGGPNVYAGGAFSTASGVHANGVGMWNGSFWSPLGSGPNPGSSANCLAVVQGTNVYVGGNFTKAGGVTVNRVAKWDGANWSALGSGPAVVLITGALTGIGRATAVEFAKEGAHIVVAGRHDEEGDKLAG